MISSGWMSSILIIFRSMLYPRWNVEQRGSDYPLSIDLAISGSNFLVAMRMVIPLSSRPLLPALPLIQIYSPPESHLYSSPSNFSIEVNTTVLAGIFIPILNVSVVNNTLSNPSQNNNSITSFTMGRSPPSWMPSPLFRHGSII